MSQFSLVTGFFEGTRENILQIIGAYENSTTKHHLVYYSAENYPGKWPSNSRGVINGKAGRAAALPESSDTLTVFQSWGADYA